MRVIMVRDVKFRVYRLLEYLGNFFKWLILLFRYFGSRHTCILDFIVYMCDNGFVISHLYSN
jgi:hypothetical protein